MKLFRNARNLTCVSLREHAMIRLLALFLFLPALAQAGERTFGNGTLTEYLSIYDIDNSGGLSEEELQTLRADRNNRQQRLRNRWDLNNDGRISEPEREAAKAAIRRQIEERRLQRFSEVDLNKDRVLSPAEFNQIAAVSDANSASPGLASRLFANLDSDKNGTISTREFLLKLDTLPVDTVDGNTPLAHPKTTRNITPAPSPR